MYDLNDETDREFDRRATRCNISVAALGKKHQLTIEEAEHVRVWIDDWYDAPDYYFDFFNLTGADGRTEFERWLESHRAQREEVAA